MPQHAFMNKSREALILMIRTSWKRFMVQAEVFVPCSATRNRIVLPSALLLKNKPVALDQIQTKKKSPASEMELTYTMEKILCWTYGTLIVRCYTLIFCLKTKVSNWKCPGCLPIMVTDETENMIHNSMSLVDFESQCIGDPNCQYMAHHTAFGLCLATDVSNQSKPKGCEGFVGKKRSRTNLNSYKSRNVYTPLPHFT